ncbi:MAG: G5 domain-containing protein, partial [Bacillota bacterium]
GIKPDKNDRVSPSLDTRVRAGMTITHTVVEVTYISRTEVVPYSTVYKKSSALYKGKEKIETYGVNGKISHKIRINYEDGKEISRYEIDSAVVRVATNEVVLVGTKVASKTSSSSATSNSNRSSGSSGSVAVSGNISPSKIKKTLRLNATAYTYTGHRTATGTNPHRGTIAVNPDVIPYGTRMYIEGYGYGVAEDTGAFIYSYPNRIDLFMESFNECYSWGSRTVTVYILK